MKKILVIAIVMIASINMIEAHGVCFGIKAGLNLENIIGLNSGQGVVGATNNESAKMTFGYHAGILVKVGFDEHWSLVPEVIYTTGGARTSIQQTFTLLGATYTTNTTGTLSLNYIQVPLFVNYKFDNGLYLEAGPYFAMLVGSSKSTTNSNGNSTASSSDTSNNKLDLGVGAGVGYRFCNGFGLNLRYNYGLNSVYKEERGINDAGIIYTEPAYGKNGVMQFSVSYLFGCSSCTPKEAKRTALAPTPEPTIVAAVPTPAPIETDVQFSIEPPLTVPGQHIVIETLPLRDYVFFDAGNTNIPSRYTVLSKEQATSFTEGQLQDCKKNPGTRTSRQLSIYYNVINIVGDRMRNYPNSSIKLIGSSAGKGTEIATSNANSIKTYLVNNFGIDPKRITVEGKNQPGNPSVTVGNTTDLTLTSAEDNRVRIVSVSSDLMLEVKGNSALCLKPIAVTAMDGSSAEDAPIFVNVGGANETLVSWSVDVTDSKGNVLNFGPFTRDKETISSAAIMKENESDRYTIVLTGKTKAGNTIRKESSFELVKQAQPNIPEQSATILFEFDKSVTVATFQNFLNNTVAPLIPSNATVIISGHTDIIGSKEYNMTLSKERAEAAQAIIESAMTKAGKTGITYNTDGYGETDPAFANTLPEERFYNRSVTIDIIPSSVVVNK